DAEPPVVLPAHPVGVLTEVEAVLAAPQRRHGLPPGDGAGRQGGRAWAAAWVPVHRHAGGGGDGGDAEPIDGAGTCLVARVRIVQPAEVPAEVDHPVGDLDRGDAVVAGEGDPGADLVATAGVGLEAGQGVTVRGRPAAAAVAAHDEVAAVSREADILYIVHKNARHAGRGVLLGAPVQQRRRTGEVDERDLVPRHPVDLGEVSTDHKGPTIWRDV